MEQLEQDMLNCPQTEGLDVLAHGRMVNDYFHDLKSHVLEGTELKYMWKLPTWAS